MGWAIAAPQRGRYGPASPIDQDQVQQWPQPPGGASGAIATPSRLSAATGDGYAGDDDGTATWAAAPPIDGAFGPILANRVYAPPIDQDTFPDPGYFPLPRPRGYDVTRYVRQYHDNLTPVATFVEPRQARTGWTANVAEEMGACGCDGAGHADVPHDRRRVVWTFRDEFDLHIQADYLPREDIQKSLKHRKLYQAPDNPQMGKPAFPLLTVWRAPGSFGQQTQVLAPVNPQLVTHSPMATAGAEAPSRFTP